MKKYIKTVLALVLIAVMLSSLALGVSAEETSGAENTVPEITSGNQVVVRSVETGQLLFDCTEGQRVCPGVSAKLMCAMVAYDITKENNQNDFTKVTMTVPRNATLAQYIGMAGIDNPILGYKVGDTTTLDQLLQATLIASSNDACYTIAYNLCDGDMESFIERMNAKAAELGCTDTLYTTVTGLNDGVAYTTARDVSLVAKAFYSYDKLLKISEKAKVDFGPAKTRNYLISRLSTDAYYISGFRGMAAGQCRTDGGYCLITCMEANGLAYVFVVMEAPGEDRTTGKPVFPENNAYSDIKKIYKWATTSFGYASIVKAGEILGELTVSVATDNTDHISFVAETGFELLLPSGYDETLITKDIVLESEELEAPVAKGQKVGVATYYFSGEKIAEINLITNTEVERSKILSIFGTFKSFLKSSALKTVIKVIIIVVICYLVFIAACKIYKIIIKANRLAQKNERNKQRNAKRTTAQNGAEPKKQPSSAENKE